MVKTIEELALKYKIDRTGGFWICDASNSSLNNIHKKSSIGKLTNLGGYESFNHENNSDKWTSFIFEYLTIANRKRYKLEMQ